MGAEIVTVSTDSEHVHLAWRHYEKELSKVSYLMGSDRQHAVVPMFGAFDETSGRAQRGTFIINLEGC